MRAIRITETGGPEVLHLEEVDLPQPGPGQVRVRVEAAGVNFVDTYQRSGAYGIAVPSGLGMEGAGVVDAVGPDVGDVQQGDRLAWASAFGSYAEAVVVAANTAVAVPESVDSRTAAAVMLQGMTAHYLATSTYPLQPGDTALVYAAAGGVGHLLTQIAKQRGARVIATASNEEKERLAREAGADEVIRYTEVDIATTVSEMTDGRGVDVVYDSVGKTTFGASLDSLRPRGMMVLYGQSSGPVPDFNPQTLNAKGSLYLTRPSLGHYTRTRDELLSRATHLFEGVTAGTLSVRIDRTWPLAEAADAHRYLQGGQSKGKLLLLPSVE